MNTLNETGECAFEAIREMVEALTRQFPGDPSQREIDEAREAAEQLIHKDPLSIQVRSDWHTPGQPPGTPQEYEILLSTGGPATRIIGKLNQYCEPETAELQVQDWFVPWKAWAGKGFSEAILLEYARQFYFGE